MVENIDLQKLKSHLWASANILRGSIDSSDFKNYIFGMLFFKRLSDVFDEEYEVMKAKVGDKLSKSKDMYTRFYRPDDCSWNDILQTSTNIGEKINDVFSKITRANSPKLDGILDRIDFNDRELLSDAVLSDLVQHFNKISLNNTNVTGDVLGQAYEYLIEQFADDAGKKGGEFYTPAMVVKLLVKILSPKELESVYDPACGSGGMLVHAADYLKKCGQDPVKLFMYGQEKIRPTYLIARMNMFLHGYDNAHIERGDTFTEPKHLENGQLKKFDIVLANPMWNQPNWHRDQWVAGDPFNRFPFGLPPKKFGDWAWIQLMYASLKTGGRMGIVMDNGALYRGNSETRIRRQFIENYFLEAVIGLPENLFYNTNQAGCLLIFNDNKPEIRKGKIIFIDASKNYIQSTNQNLLREKDLDKTVTAFDSFETIERYCTVSNEEEVKENDYYLNIGRYVDIIGPETIVNIPNVIENMKNLEVQRNDAKNKLDKHLMNLKSFQESKLGRIPDDWEILLLKEVFDFIPTTSHSKAQMTYEDTESNIFNVHYGAMHTTYKDPILDFTKYNIPKIKDNAKMPNEKNYLKSGDLVLVDASEDLIGLTTCVELKNINGKKVVGGLHTFALRDKKGKTAEGFRSYLFNNYSVKKVMMSYANHSKVYGITKTSLGNVPLILPTIPEQQKIAEFLYELETQIDGQIKKEEATRLELEKLRKGLIQVFLTGKTRIRT